jgi:hypothetical protein
MAVTHRTFIVNLTVIVPAEGDPELQTPRGIENEIMRCFEALDADVQSITVIEELEQQ